jgi:phosphohistidine phosphatase SixA
VFAVPSAIEQWRLRSSPEARARQTLEAMVKQWQNGEKKAVLQKMNEYSRELPYAKDDNRAFEF